MRDLSYCNGCEVCVNICPKNCISMQSDKDGFLYPHVDESDCIDCGLCRKKCPVLNPQLVVLNANMYCYAGFTENDEVRKKSSSGGVFYAVAQKIIEDDGIVFGASFNESFQVVHSYAEDIDGIAKFQGSKYVQSRIDSSYKKAKAFLDEGRLVYFSGTPCEVAGLKTFLSQDYDNLICQDLICHGVPSPGLWKKYLHELQEEGIIEQIQFRNKDKGWNSSQFFVKFKDGHEFAENKDYNAFVCPFLCNLTLRESCYDCKYKTANRCSDITLADFWGVDQKIGIENDDKGLSFVIAHTEKGRSLLENSDLCLQSVELSQGIKENRALVESSGYTRDRELYLDELRHNTFKKTFLEYFEPTLFDRVRLKIKRMSRYSK